MCFKSNIKIARSGRKEVISINKKYLVIIGNAQEIVWLWTESSACVLQSVCFPLLLHRLITFFFVLFCFPNFFFFSIRNCAECSIVRNNCIQQTRQNEQKVNEVRKGSSWAAEGATTELLVPCRELEHEWTNGRNWQHTQLRENGLAIWISSRFLPRPCSFVRSLVLRYLFDGTILIR